MTGTAVAASGGERRLTPRGRERRRQLLEYAAKRFAESGYHPTSVADIVGGLGVGKGVFYWYFDSKEQLFLELLREAQTDLRRTQRDAIVDAPDPVRRLELGIWPWTFLGAAALVLADWALSGRRRR